MQLISIAIGAIIGGAIGFGGGTLGVIAGAVIGYLFYAQGEFRRQVEALKEQVELLSTALRSVQDAQREARRPGIADSTENFASRMSQPETSMAPAAAESESNDSLSGSENVEDDSTEPLLPAMTPATLEATRAAAAVESAEVVKSSAVYSESPREPDAVERLLAAVKGWFTTGNVPVKLGVVVSFFGVAFLLKYAVDHSVLNIPIEVRYLFVAAATLALLVFGWRLKDSSRVYALSLQGGAIGILYLTIFAAFNVHHILPSAFAFFLLVLVTIAAGVLAVVQNAHALAVLGVVGGFLAPVLVSSGSGNHVALFGYYLVLNIAVLGIAWHRSWRLLNILGFVFTFGVATLWGRDSYVPDKFATTEPFLVLFFLFYTAIPILYAFRQPPNLRGVVDGTLVFGTPSIAFALQSLLLDDTEYGLAISAIVVAIFYAGLTLWLHRQYGQKMRLLVQSFLALAVAFATIAIPLALDDRWSSVSWALEGAALIWIGVRQNHLLPKIAGSLLSFASGYFFISHGWQHDAGLPVLNGNALGGAVISLAALLSSRLLSTDERRASWQSVAGVVLMVWGLGWWFGTGSVEIADRVRSSLAVFVWPVFVALSFAALSFWASIKNWNAARRASLVFLAIVPLISIWYYDRFGNLLVEWGWLVWPLLLATHLWVLKQVEPNDRRVLHAWHFGGALMFLLFASYEAGHAVDAVLNSDTWAFSAAIALLFCASFLLRQQRALWPMRQFSSAYQGVDVSLVLLGLATIFVFSLNDSGSATPLPYLPILNPVDILTLAGLWLAWPLIGKASQEAQTAVRAAWFAAAFILTTLMVIRAVFHFTNLTWDWGRLYDAGYVQAALSIYWAVLGIGGMMLGTRGANRRIWMAGVALMAVVVAKLFLVDFSNSGTVAGIVSFIGVGLLLLIVGYFAPVPPRQTENESTG